MKFRVTGQNRETGARQIMEFEAESKGAAERKADKVGMSVNHATLIADTVEAHDTPVRKASGGVSGKLVWIVVIAVVVVAVMNWGRLKELWGG